MTVNQRVPGSSPGSGATKNQALAAMQVLFSCLGCRITGPATPLFWHFRHSTLSLVIYGQPFPDSPGCNIFLKSFQRFNISPIRGAESSYVPLKSLPLLQTAHTNIPPEALSDFRGYIRITLFEITAVQHRRPAPWPGVQPEETPESCLPGY